jgi:hypothetical protein
MRNILYINRLKNMYSIKLYNDSQGDCDSDTVTKEQR